MGALARRITPWLARWWLAALCLCATALALWWQPPALLGLRNAQFDQFQRWQPRQAQRAPLTVVEVDEASLRALGQWPWPRERLAQLLDTLRKAGAAVVVLDILLAEPDRTAPKAMARHWGAQAGLAQALATLPDPDAALAQHVAQGQVVLGMTLHGDAANAPAPAPDAVPQRVQLVGADALSYLYHYDGLGLPLPVLAEAATGLGLLNFVPDRDGVLRRVPLVLRWGERALPTLVTEALRVALGARDITVQAAPERGAGLQSVHIGTLALPVSAEGEVWLHYGQGRMPGTLSAADVLQGRTAGVDWRGHVMLVGSSALGLMDLRATPLGTSLPGVQIHAQALEQMLNGGLLERPVWAPGLEALWALLACALVAGVSSTVRVARAALVAGVVWLGSAGAAWGAFSQGQLLLDATPALLWSLLAFVLCSARQHWASERQQRWVREAFARYVSPNLVQHLVEHPEELELGGKRRVCSFVFTDLAGFTRLMETLDPAQAVSLLNPYLDRMVAIAFAHQGTLDRIVGDAVAIVFSTPVVQADHAQRALDCALEMHAFAQAYTAQVQAQGMAFGHTRIGVHTGEVIVGNFGGSTMFDYRALGDAVNTASRLEGANKYLGTRVCVSLATVQACTGARVRPVARLVVQGREQALAVFEPWAASACADADEGYVRAYEHAYALLARGDSDQAQAAFAALVRMRSDDILVRQHLQRLQTGAQDDRWVLGGK